MATALSLVLSSQDSEEMVQTRRAKQTLRDTQGTTDVVSQLPHELGLKILSFASADAVVAACGVAKHWRDLGGTDALWRPLCHSLWRGKLNFEGRTRPLAAAVRDDAIVARGAPVARGAAARVAYDWDGADPWIGAHERLERLDWRASYELSLRDAARTRIADDELARIPWFVCFGDAFVAPRLAASRQLSDAAMAQARATAGHTFARFSLDDDAPRTFFSEAEGYYTDSFYSHLPGDPLEDSHLAGGVATWRRDKNDGIKLAKFASFHAPLEASRRGDWGWRLANNYVLKESCDAGIVARDVWKSPEVPEEDQPSLVDPRDNINYSPPSEPTWAPASGVAVAY